MSLASAATALKLIPRPPPPITEGEAPAEVLPEYLEDRQKLSESLTAFTKACWHVIEPRKELVWGWHIDCIMEHMEAVFLGEIRVLIINIPPGHFKSSSVSVIFPAWCWTSRPEMRFLTGSYSLLPVPLRDARKSRRILTSPWFRARWPEVELLEDQNEKGNYANTLSGGRYCFGTSSGITGEHAHIALWDDPLKAADAYSDIKRQQAIDFLTETLPSRFLPDVDPTMIVMQQRLHENDPSGYLLREAAATRDRDVVHVQLPAHFDPERRCSTLWYRDPRKEKGQLLWPELFDERRLKQRYGRMSPRAQEAQLEQRPSIPGGNIIKRKDWLIWPQPLPSFSHRLITFDPAMKDKDTGSYWACTVWGIFIPQDCWHPDYGEPLPHIGDLADEHSMMLIGGWHKHCNYPEAKRRLLDTVLEWTFDEEPPDWVVIEDKAMGIYMLEELERAGTPGVERWDPGTKSKTERAELASDLWQAGRVWVPGKKLAKERSERSALHHVAWAEEIIEECAQFPNGEHDDYLDACSMAAAWLRQAGLVKMESDIEEEEAAALPPKGGTREAVYG